MAGYAHPDFPNAASSQPEELRFLIAGMPNVGKSSILNALRRVGVNRGKLPSRERLGAAV